MKAKDITLKQFRAKMAYMRASRRTIPLPTPPIAIAVHTAKPRKVDNYGTSLARLGFWKDATVAIEDQGLLRANRIGWRFLSNPHSGSVNGLPSINGTLVATNGVLALIINAEGHKWIVHLENFVRSTANEGLQFAQTRKSKLATTLEDYA